MVWGNKNGIFLSVLCLCLPLALAGQATSAPPPLLPASGPAISLSQALQLAARHSPALAAARANIPQSQAQEVTAGLRPNPVLAWDALFIPVFSPNEFNRTYLNNSSEFDASVA
ncbi:MAG: hypothetical protein ACREKE_06020, partial [bacterium]